MNRHASARWLGPGKDGKGALTSDSGVLKDTAYSFHTRFEDGKGTNPEELIAAAHAGCFCMQLAFVLSGAGHPPESLDCKADVSLQVSDSGATIDKIHLDLVGKVPGLSAADFEKHAQNAKSICPVSKRRSASVK